MNKDDKGIMGCLIVVVGILAGCWVWGVYHNQLKDDSSASQAPQNTQEFMHSLGLDSGDTPQVGRFFFHVETKDGSFVIYRMNTITGQVDVVEDTNGTLATAKIMEPTDKTHYTGAIPSAKN